MKKKNKISCLSDKKEWIAIDICKVVCAYGVVSIHLLPFADVSWEFMFWFNQVLCRLAVPFFFLSSGFFLFGKIHQRDQMFRYVKRLLKLYVLYTLLHMGLIVKSYEEDGILIQEMLPAFLKDFLITGIYVQLWYLPALAVAVILCYLLVEKFGISEKIIAAVTMLCYLLGAMVNVYGPFLEQNAVLNGVITGYKQIFETTRNGVFFGFPYVFWGMLLKKYADRIKASKKNRFVWIFLLCLFGMSAEAYLVRAFTLQENFSMLFMTPITVVCLFLGLSFMEVPVKYMEVGVVMRKVSFLIYAWHMLVHKYCGPYVYYKMDSQWYYLVIVISTTILSVGIVFCSKWKRFQWLKNLY